MSVGAEVSWRASGPPATPARRGKQKRKSKGKANGSVAAPSVATAKWSTTTCWFHGSCGQPVVEGRRSCQEHVERVELLARKARNGSGRGR